MPPPYELKPGWTFSKACYICGGPNISHVDTVRDALGLWRCKDCRLLFLNPRPPATGMAYSGSFVEGFYRSLQQDGRVDAEGRPQYEKLAASYPEVVELARSVYNGEDILEVGCGAGCCMLALQGRGMRVKGVEPSPDFASFGRTKFGLDIEVGDVMQFTPRQRASIVVASSCIEHIHEPINALRAIRERILAPNGHLIVTAPNIDSLEYLRDGTNWHNFNGDHLWYFSEESLAMVAARAGYRVVRFYRPSFELPGDMQPSHRYVRDILGLDVNVYGGIGMLLTPAEAAGSTRAGAKRALRGRLSRLLDRATHRLQRALDRAR